MWTTKLLIFFSRANKSLFDISVEVQKDFLCSQPLPHNCIDRSYNQYKAQLLFYKKWMTVSLNAVSFVMIPLVIFWLLVKSIVLKKGKSVDAIGEFKGLEETLPETVSNEYVINNELWAKGSSLVFSDLKYILKLLYGKQPYYSLKTIVKISQYSHCIRSYSPKAIIVHNEYSFTSSALTGYCREHNVRHINAMHGEKLYNIRDSWFQYDMCYVWDKHYVELFVALKAEPSQFIIEMPPSLKIVTSEHINLDVFAEYKYYLANSKEEEVMIIANKLHNIAKQSHSIKVRLHPRYSNINMIKKYFSESEIEYPQQVSIIDSISNVDYVIGSYSTVLLQAYFSGKKIIFDDVAYKEQYDKLFSLYYILACENNLLLSQI